jgi:DNA-binding MarR family transcriptional regulator
MSREPAPREPAPTESAPRKSASRDAASDSEADPGNDSEAGPGSDPANDSQPRPGSGSGSGSENDPPGFELPLRLLMAFRVLIDEVHADLARQGHPDMRPMYGFVFQAIGPHGTTAADLGRTLGVSKQAAGKTIDGLERLGYVERGADPNDARRKVVRLTARGYDSLAKSAASFDRLRAVWAAELGADRLRALEHDLRLMTPGGSYQLDMTAWFGGG